jgi:hypothetical protein
MVIAKSIVRFINRSPFLPQRLATVQLNIGFRRLGPRQDALVVSGSPCYRRVGKLYLPPGGRYFGCRHCYDLTYTSCQEHDKRVDALRRNPELLAAILVNPDAALDSKLILALKAVLPREL